MATIANAELVKHLDSLAAQYGLLKDDTAGLGDGSGATSVSAGAASIEAAILASTDREITEELLGAAIALAERTKYRTTRSGIQNSAATLLRGYLDVIITHLGGNLDTHLTTQVLRVHPDLGELYYDMLQSRLSRANIFPLVTVLGAVVHQQTFTPGENIDENHGPAQLELEATHAIGGVDWILTLTCKKLDDSTEQKIVTMPNGSQIGTKVAVGTGANVYVDVTAVTATGGTALDAVQIQTKLLREIALIVA